MTTNENIMSEMLERVTSRETPDELAMQMFVLVVQKDVHMIGKAQEMLIAKIRSHNVTVSTRAVALLEECMTKCGTEFQDEIAKFRFLNELIRLVSKKYQGDSTPVAIKQRIMECLLLWTTEFPTKSKIREAYDMLNKEGSVAHGHSETSVAKRESVLGIDDKMLANLINSNDPENFKRANIYIQYHVNQEARREDLRLQQKLELQEVQNTVELFNQMLNVFETEGDVDIKGGETVNIMRELYQGCKKHKSIIQRLPELIGNTNESLLDDVLEANDALQAVMKRYKDFVGHQISKDTSRNKTPSHDLLSELLDMKSDALIPKVTPTEEIVSNGQSNLKTTSQASNNFDELNEIFGSVENKATNVSAATANYQDEILDNLDLLKPVNVFTKIETPEASDKTETNQVGRRAFRELREIDKLSDELFKQNMQTSDRVGSFKKKEPERLTLNDLVKEKTQNIKPEISSNTSTPVKILADTNEPKASIYNLDDDEILDVKQEVDNTELESLKGTEVTEKSSIIETKSDEKPISLSEIEIDLDDLTPCGMERILLEDDDIKVTLNFTEDRPSKNISVIVIAVSNKSKQPLKDFNFEASVKKPCKVRLLPPTDIALPPFKPYRPPTPINQVLLLLNPTGKEIDVTCIFGYKLGNDPDPIKESIIAKSIPYVD